MNKRKWIQLSCATLGLYITQGIIERGRYMYVTVENSLFSHLFTSTQEPDHYGDHYGSKIICGCTIGETQMG